MPALAHMPVLSRRFRLIPVLSGMVGLAACAGSGPGPEGGVAGPGGTSVPPSYALTAEEQGLDCRRLTGRMQVRLLSLRGTEHKVGPSQTANTMRSVTSTAFMTGTSANAEARAASDRPVLEAYNRRLVELGCPSFDLDKELAARPSAPSPAPTVPAAGKAKP